MHGVPTRRVFVYVAAGLIVLAVGVAGLWASRGAEGGGDVVLETAVEVAEAGSMGSAAPGGIVGDAGSSSTTSTIEVAKIWVQVAGAVRRPGVYQVESGARAFEAVLAAGGFAENADQQGVALAARLSDGCRLYVPVGGEAPAGQVQAPTQSMAGLSGGPAAPEGAAGGAAGPVSLNTATLEQLDSLPGVGPALAQQIVTYREANGPFISVDQLDEVPGIGPAKLEQLRPLVGL